MNLVDQAINQYAEQHTQNHPSLLEELNAYTYEHTEMPQMLSGKIPGRLLNLLVAVSSARRVLEIGMFTGYSALSLAESLPADGEVVCCELNGRYIEIAQSFFARSPHGSKIKVLAGPAQTSLAQLSPESFDLVFIDANKEAYPQYYESAVGLLRPRGLLVVDNCLWSGKVLDPQDEESQAIAQLNRTIAADSRVINVLLPVRDGLNLVMKKEAV